MRPRVFWIQTPNASRMAIMARPRAGDWLMDEIAGWKSEGIEVVVSLLEPDESTELGLSSEAELCESLAMEFVAFPIPDRGAPASMSNAAALARLLKSRLDTGKAIAIHCRAGIGRSALMAATVLVWLGESTGKAFDAVEDARGLKVPDTDEQRQWVAAFEEAVRGERHDNLR